MLIVLYATYIGLIALVREIIKDLAAIKGDMLFGYKTFPVVFGIRKTKMLVVPVMLLCLPLGYLLFLALTPAYSSIYFLVSFVSIFVIMFFFASATHQKQYHQTDNFYKFLIVLGILNISLV